MKGISLILSLLAWDMPGLPDAATAQACTYTCYVEGLLSRGIVLVGVRCAGRATITCAAPLPIMRNRRTFTLTATCGGVESLPSAPIRGFNRVR